MSSRGALDADLESGVIVIGGSPRGWRLTVERDSHGDGHVHIERQLWDDNRGEWRENDCILNVTVEQQRALAVFFAAQAHVGMCAVCRSPLQGGPDSGVPYPPIVKGALLTAARGLESAGEWTVEHEPQWTAAYNAIREVEFEVAALWSRARGYAEEPA